MGALDALVESVCDRWALTPIEALAGGRCSAVVGAVAADGAEVVVKVAPDSSAVLHEARTYSAWWKSATACCPRVLARDEAVGAICVERLRPGDVLALRCSTGSDEVEFLASVLHTVACDGRELTGFPPASGRLTERFEPMSSRVPLIEHLDVDLVLSTFADSMAVIDRAAATSVLCHGDIHPGNVIRSGSDLKVVDPIGVVGPAEFDVAVFAVNAGGGHAVAERLELFSRELGLDHGLLTAYGLFFAAERLVVHHWHNDERLDPVALLEFIDSCEPRLR